MYHNHISLDIPDSKLVLYPGNKIKLGRFNNDVWTVCYGWYSFGGNRPFCGWYLVREDDMQVKPLQLPDLDDIYIIQT